MKTLATMSALLIGAMLASAQTAEELTTQEVFNGKNGAKLLYRQYVPKDLAPDAKIPLVLFLHGAGERGDDNTAQLKHGVGAIIKYSQEKQMPIAMLVPQCPNNQMWVNKPWGATSHHMDKSPTGNLAMVLSLGCAVWRFSIPTKNLTAPSPTPGQSAPPPCPPTTIKPWPTVRWSTAGAASASARNRTNCTLSAICESAL